MLDDFLSKLSEGMKETPGKRGIELPDCCRQQRDVLSPLKQASEGELSSDGRTILLVGSSISFAISLAAHALYHLWAEVRAIHYHIDGHQQQ